MSTVWRTSLAQNYNDAIDVLKQALRECPDDLWGASIWEVRLTDRHVWPIVQGVGAELPDEERLQLHSAFWVVAYHVIFFLDHYLGGGLGDPKPPSPFRGDEQKPHTLPHRVYTREELLDYLEYCRRKAESTLAGLTDEQAERPARIGRPFADLLVRNLVQVIDHGSQLNLFLSLKAGLPDSRWTQSDRWFRRCPDCP